MNSKKLHSLSTNDEFGDVYPENHWNHPIPAPKTERNRKPVGLLARTDWQRNMEVTRNHYMLKAGTVSQVSGLTRNKQVSHGRKGAEKPNRV